MVSVANPVESGRAKHALSVVEKLDLSPILFKLTHPKEGLGWNADQACDAELWYRRFLALHVLHPTKTIVPSKTIDDFWHQHILDTQKYAQDCDRLFGHFLHHYPYFGLNGAEDAQALEAAFVETCALFEAAFGETPTEVAGCKKCRSCGSTSSCNNR